MIGTSPTPTKEVLNMPKTNNPATASLSEADQLKARLAEIRAEEKKAREKARAKREKEEAETAELRKQVEAELTSARDEMATAKAAFEKAKAKVDEVRSRLPKGARGAGIRVPKDPNRLSAIQLRILVWMHGRKSASRQEMSDAGTGKQGSALNGLAIGNVDPATRSPYSLLGRGLLEVEEVEADGKKVYAYGLTAEGRKATKAARAAKP
jgi:hypothetical protein